MQVDKWMPILSFLYYDPSVMALVSYSVKNGRMQADCLFAFVLWSQHNGFGELLSDKWKLMTFCFQFLIVKFFDNTFLKISSKFVILIIWIFLNVSIDKFYFKFEKILYVETFKVLISKIIIGDIWNNFIRK